MGRALLAQMLLVMVVRVARTRPSPSAAETGVLRIQARRKYFFATKQTHPAAEHKDQSVFKLEFSNTLTKEDVRAEKLMQSVAEARRCERCVVV